MGVTVAGDPSGNAGPYAYQLNNPTTVILDPYGYIYILDNSNTRVQKWYLGSTYGTTVLSATLSNPQGMTVDLLGNLVIADTNYQRVLSFHLYCRK